MAELFNITHKDDDLNEYDTTVTDGGNLSTSAAAALAGTNFGLSALINDTNAIYGQKNFTLTTSVIRFRFYLDPNGVDVATADNKEFNVIVLYDTAESHADFQLRLGQIAASGFNLDIRTRNNDFSWDASSKINITDAPHLIECSITSAGASELFIDGVSSATITGTDISADFNQLDKIRIGASGGIDAGASGTIYLDELVANDDGSEIGGVTNVTSLNVAGQGWVENLQTTSGTGTEIIKAAPGPGLNLYLEEVIIVSGTATTVIIGSGETSGAVTTKLIGPIEMTTSGRPYKIRFPRPIIVDVNTSLTVDSGVAGNVQVSTTGYTK